MYTSQNFTSMKYIYCLLCVLLTQYGFSQQEDSTTPLKEHVNPYAEKPLLVNQFLYFDIHVLARHF